MSANENGLLGLMLPLAAGEHALHEEEDDGDDPEGYDDTGYPVHDSHPCPVCGGWGDHRHPDEDDRDRRDRPLWGVEAEAQVRTPIDDWLAPILAIICMSVCQGTSCGLRVSHEGIIAYLNILVKHLWPEFNDQVQHLEYS